MINSNKLEQWFDNLPKFRQVELQKRYFDYNKYFEELNRDWWFDNDYKYETIRFVEHYGGQVLTNLEFTQLQSLEYD